MRESSIQNEIRLALSEYGLTFRTNSGEFWQGKLAYSKEFKQRVLINLRRVDGLPEGFTDLLFFGFDGRPAFIEVKRPGEKPRDEQENFMEIMRRYGYIADIAHSVAEAVEVVRRETK